MKDLLMRACVVVRNLIKLVKANYVVSVILNPECCSRQSRTHDHRGDSPMLNQLNHRCALVGSGSDLDILLLEISKNMI